MGKKKVKPEETPDKEADAAESGADSKKAAASSAKDDNKEIGPANGPRDLRKRGCTDCC